jgi:hypothetical protein
MIEGAKVVEGGFLYGTTSTFADGARVLER